jgi:hypothetical protein
VHHSLGDALLAKDVDAAQLHGVLDVVQADGTGGVIQLVDGVVLLAKVCSVGAVALAPAAVLVPLGESSAPHVFFIGSS